MLKREIKFMDLDDNEVTETHHFNLSKREVIALQIDPEKGLRGAVEKLMAEANDQKMFEWFEEFILAAYGERPDATHFVKSDESKKSFRESLAFDQLIFEMLSDENVAADFLIGIMPNEIRSKVDMAEVKKELKTAIDQRTAAEEAKTESEAPKPPTT